METQALTSLVEDLAQQHEVPGAVVGLLRNEQSTVVHTGVTDVTSGEAITSETRFAVGSVTKPIAATLLLYLARDGYLSLDDRVSNHVAALGDNTWARQTTIRDLLANRSRIPLRASWEFELQGDDREVLMRSTALVGTEGPIGPFWSYANLGWVVLGHVVEVVTGITWEEAVTRHVLDPLGMDQTTFALRPASEPRAVGHETGPQGPEPVPAWTPRAYCSAGTSLLSTVTDLLKFAARHLEDPYLATMRETHAEVAIHGWLDGWGLGWARFDWDGDPSWGWDGVVPGQRTVLRLLPEHEMAVVLATNGSAGRVVARDLLPRFTEHIGVAVPPLRLDSVPANDLDLYEGEYAWPDRLCRVTASTDHLVIEVDDRRLAAFPTGNGVFLVNRDNPDNPTVTFGAFDTDGRPQVIYLMLWGLPRR